MYKLSLLLFLLLSNCCIVYTQSSVPDILTSVKNNETENVRSLLGKGADPNSHDEDGDNLLMYAALYSSIDCMKLLLEKGADINAKNKLDETALMWAINPTS
jgi:ankyrin repeat protein